MITRPAITQTATHDLSEEQAQKTQPAAARPVGEGRPKRQPDRQQREPALLAHRGLVRHAPENTLPAFAAAVELGLSIELDVYQTSDKQLVVIHDKTVDRTTNGSGEVTKMTLAEIRELDAGSWFHPRYAGLKVPTLEEAFQLIRERQRKPVTIALNMKVISPGIEANIAKLVEKYDMFDQLFAFGQPEDSSKRFKQANPKLRTTEVKIYDSEHFARALKNPLADCLWVGFIPSRDEMSQARKLGKQVWLSLHIGDKRPDIWDKARASQMDGICTDWPLECRLLWRKENATQASNYQSASAMASRNMLIAEMTSDRIESRS
ncbi:MAG: hypothetical protein CMJ64_27775 [Planctomycetaceae bacterium]|nr:hypothetical protein [Planctomycetaceae bacterium]